MSLYENDDDVMDFLDGGDGGKLDCPSGTRENSTADTDLLS
jgi:hypothetical protein